MKTNTIIQTLKAVAVLTVLFSSLFFIFCQPDETQNPARFLWTLLWTKTLGVVLFGAVIIFCKVQNHARA